MHSAMAIAAQSVDPECPSREAAVQTLAINAITITNDITWRRSPSIGFRELAGNPLSGRMCAGSQPQDLAPIVLQK